jgi:hypothetical protein
MCSPDRERHLPRPPRLEDHPSHLRGVGLPDPHRTQGQRERAPRGLRDENGQVVDVKVRNTGPDGTKKDFYWASGKAPKGLVYGAHSASATAARWSGHRDGREGPPHRVPVVGQQVPRHLPPGGEPDQGPRPPPPQIPLREGGHRPGHGRAGAEGWPEGRPDAAPGARHTSASSPTRTPTRRSSSGCRGPHLRHPQRHPFRPDGIVDADDLDGELLNPTQWGLSLPWPL